MKSRFEDAKTLEDALAEQKIVQGNRDIAKAIAAEGVLQEFSPGQNIIEQGGSGRDVYFLLSGKCQLVVHGVRLYSREHG